MRFSIQINKFLVFIFGLLLISCQPQSERKKPVQIKSIQLTEDTVKFINKDTVNELKQELTEVINDSDFVFLDEIDTTFCYDLKYATADNFLNERVYECANCILRYESVLALQKANTIFKTQGYRIQFFDCYRPVEVQKKMWEIMPDGRYVANPYKSGSIHNRGMAVDLTLVDSLGKELDMGTPFDHFGEEAHHAFTDLSDSILTNRKLLKEGMEAAGFTALRTEWWHYLYGEKLKYPLGNADLCK